MLQRHCYPRKVLCQAGATGRAPADSQQSTSRKSRTSARIYSASQYGPNHTKESADSTPVINRARSVRSVHAEKKHRKAGTDEGHQHLVTLADVQQQYQAQLVSAPFSNTGGHLQLHSREIRYADNRSQASFWLQELLYLADTASDPVLVGFDTETPVTRTRGVYKRTALMQLCYHHPIYEEAVCLLIPIDRLRFTAEIQAVMSHKRIIKIGIALAEDMLRLQRDSQIASRTVFRSMLDLSWLAYACYTPKPCSHARVEVVRDGAEPYVYQESWSMAGLMQEVTQSTISKNSKVRCSNWAARPLSDKQISYAAADAYAGLVLYHSLWLKWIQVQQQQQLEQAAHNNNNATSGDISRIASRAEQAAAAASSVLAGQQPGQAEGGSLGSRCNVPGLGSSQPHEQLQQQPHDMQYTLNSKYLTQPRFWDQFLPAVALKRQWQSEVLQEGIKATAQQLKRLRNNMVLKLDLAILQLGATLNRISPPGECT